MEKILDLNSEFDVKLFDEVVSTALNPSSPSKTSAESILLQFKELPGSWTRIDSILKNSSSKQSKFIALQVLEETVKSKWVLFNEEMKAGLRQYVFTTVIERSAQPHDIILQKFNSVLIEIVKRDWPKKWPTFINDLISVSQTTSMEVSMNSLVILKNMNEQIFIVEDDITTTKKRLLRKTLKQEYFTIFQFISLILEYSETQELEDSLLESCLNAFKSFCKSMPPEFVFSTRIVDYILGHLNSPHSIATINCLMEIIEMKKASQEANTFERSMEVVEFEKQKVILIHNELLNFFKLYLGKFESAVNNQKLHIAYKHMTEQEQMFVKKYTLIFCSMYSNWLYDLNIEQVKQGLGYLIQLSKIEDASLFREIFTFWSKFVYEMYSEYPLRLPTSKSLKRSSFNFIFESLLPILVNNMPRPVEVFILVNDLGEIVRDKKVETIEIEFYKKMKMCIFYLSYCIENFMTDFFQKKIEKFISMANFDHAFLNKICWSIGSIANALEESVERDFFVLILKNLLTMCEVRNLKDEKAIIASNIMFIIGQYYRFLKYHGDFLIVVVKKLFEFMLETHEGIKEMACDNFFKICEKCPNQFFIRKDKIFFYEHILNDLPSVTMNLDFYLQRMVVEGLLSVLKACRKAELKYVETIFDVVTNKKILDERYITSIHTVIQDPYQLKMAVHLIESYSLGFKFLPELFQTMNIIDSFLFFYKRISSPELSYNTIVTKNLGILKTSLANFFETIVCSGFMNADFLNSLCENVLLDYKSSYDPALLSLANSIIQNTSNFNNPIEIQRLQFIISNLLVPSVSFVLKVDEYPDLSAKYLELIKSMSVKAFKIAFPLLSENPSYESIINSIIFSLTGLHAVSQLALENLQLFFLYSVENNLFGVFNRFYLICLENILGIIFDKDMRQNYDSQVDLLFDLMRYLGRIPSLDNTNNNFLIFRNFISDLFAKNFKNLTQSSVQIFIEGIIEIKNKECFREHLDDFNVKIYEYGDEEDIQEELDLLKERIATAAN